MMTLQAKSSGEVATPVSPDVLEHLHSVGAGLLEREATLYEEGTLYIFSINLSHAIFCIVVRNTKKKSDSEWLRNVLTSGTIADKLSARTLLVQVLLLWPVIIGTVESYEMCTSYCLVVNCISLSSQFVVPFWCTPFLWILLLCIPPQ